MADDMVFLDVRVIFSSLYFDNISRIFGENMGICVEY